MVAAVPDPGPSEARLEAGPVEGPPREATPVRAYESRLPCVLFHLPSWPPLL